MKGKFITFEGSEGCGKSTQSKMVYNYLKNKGRKVLYIREPGGTKIGEKIRSILLDAKNNKMSNMCEMLLYMAARSQLVKEAIKPALKNGKIVICDRFLDSTFAYQGFGLRMDMGLIKKIGLAVTQGISPGLTIFLDLRVKKGLKHRQFIRDRIEKRPFDFHQRARQGYLKLLKLEPNRIKMVKVNREINITQQEIRMLVGEFLKE